MSCNFFGKNLKNSVKTQAICEKTQENPKKLKDFVKKLKVPEYFRYPIL